MRLHTSVPGGPKGRCFWGIWYVADGLFAPRRWRENPASGAEGKAGLKRLFAWLLPVGYFVFSYL